MEQIKAAVELFLSGQESRSADSAASSSLYLAEADRGKLEAFLLTKGLGRSQADLSWSFRETDVFGVLELEFGNDFRQPSEFALYAATSQQPGLFD